VNVNELILENLKAINTRLDQLDNKLEIKFQSLKCSEQNVRIVTLENESKDRKEHKATMWGIAIAAISAFGLSIWTWLKGT